MIKSFTIVFVLVCSLILKANSEDPALRTLVNADTLADELKMYIDHNNKSAEKLVKLKALKDKSADDLREIAALEMNQKHPSRISFSVNVETDKHLVGFLVESGYKPDVCDDSLCGFTIIARGDKFYKRLEEKKKTIVTDVAYLKKADAAIEISPGMLCKGSKNTYSSLTKCMQDLDVVTSAGGYRNRCFILNPRDGTTGAKAVLIDGVVTAYLSGSQLKAAITNRSCQEMTASFRHECKCDVVKAQKSSARVADKIPTTSPQVAPK